jgi:hypothetical protein
MQSRRFFHGRKGVQRIPALVFGEPPASPVALRHQKSSFFDAPVLSLVEYVCPFSTIVPFGSSHAAGNERERCIIGGNKEETR